MDQRHREYVEYYRARFRRYEGDAVYPRMREAERAMLDAIETAPDLETFGERVRSGSLHVRCAVALVLDQEEARARLYESLDEPVRARPHRQVVECLSNGDIRDVGELNTLVSKILDAGNIPISADEVLRDELWNDLKVLEDVQCWSEAEVPDEWRAERAEFVKETLARLSESIRTRTTEMRKFDPAYAPDWDALWQARHRRRLTVPDATLHRRIDEHRKAGGR